MVLMAVIGSICLLNLARIDATLIRHTHHHRSRPFPCTGSGRGQPLHYRTLLWSESLTHTHCVDQVVWRFLVVNLCWGLCPSGYDSWLVQWEVSILCAGSHWNVIMVTRITMSASILSTGSFLRHGDQDHHVCLHPLSLVIPASWWSSSSG